MLAAVLSALLVGTAAGGLAGALVVTAGSGSVLSWLQQNVFGITPASPFSSAGGSNQTTILVQEESATVEAVRRVSPAVVSILITKEVSVGGAEAAGPSDDFFFGFPFGSGAPGTVEKEKRQVGGGTGFVISGDGLILTNRHVVQDKEAEYTVVLADGRSFSATVSAVDPLNDLGIVKIEASDLPVVELGDSETLQIGETVIAIGNTLSELPNTVTKGVVSGLSRRIVAGDGFGRSEVIEEAIQTDAAINPGNSGGPLVNLFGQVIGVNSAVRGGAEGVGFAIPINTAKAAIDSFRDKGKIVRAWLGVRYTPITPEIAKVNRLPAESGALIVRGDGADEPAVVADSPAEKAGLKEGDIILEMDNVAVDEENSLAQIIGKHAPGDEVEVRINRGGQESVLRATLGEYPSDDVE